MSRPRVERGPSAYIVHLGRNTKGLQRDEGSGLGLLKLNTHIRFILHFNLLWSPQLDKPFIACIDLGVEPAHMPDFFSIFMNDSMDTANMKGMLQVNVSPPNASPDGGPYAQAYYGYSLWRQVWENADRMGFEANSVGLMEFGNGASQQSITCTVHIT
ncbi:hypothetical protein B0H13DRAFT_2372030 [Mycena leptocephala]|nr:hypothetical protein B0H13DRAFT_2372030 [Mycena leptocephala]